MSYYKYRNKPSYCLKHHYHDSKLEANVCNRLLAMTMNSEIKGYRSQVRFDLILDKVKVSTHIVDFLITHNNGRQEVWEAKQHKNLTWRIKYKLFRQLYPEIPYKVIEKDT